MGLPKTNTVPVLLAAREGRPGAQGELVRLWMPAVLGWCSRLGGPRVHPEDAAQDVFVKVLTRLDTIRDPERFGGWLFKVTRSVVRQHRRVAWVRGWVPGLQVELLDESDPLSRAEDAQTALGVRQALETLPAAQREAMVLCDLEERTTAEAAELLGVSQGTVKSRLRLGRERFRRAALRAGISPELLNERGWP